MEGFKIWLISLCGATAVSAVFKLLLADSSLKKVINVFFSIFILFYTVMPIQSFFKESIKIDVENSGISYEEYYKDGYEAIVTQAVINLCNNLNIRVLSMDIDSYIDNEGYLNVNKIKLRTNAENPKIVEEKIRSELGFEVEVE